MKIKVIDMHKPKTGVVEKEFGPFRYEIKWHDGSITRPLKSFTQELMNNGRKRYLITCKNKVEK